MTEVRVDDSDARLRTKRHCSLPVTATMGPWVQRAACRGSEIGPYFPHSGGSSAGVQARAVCAVCPVQAECLAHALAHSQLQGIWGGTSEQQRRALRREAA